MATTNQPEIPPSTKGLLSNCDDVKIYIQITEKPINSEDAISFLNHPSSGAINLFLGVTRRDETDSNGTVIGSIDSLYYEAYEGMAIKMMHKLIADCRSQFKINKCYIVHRIGLIKVGEASLIIGCSSAHREPAHQATYYLLNCIKSEVPIWKKLITSTNNQMIPGLSDKQWSNKSEAFWLSSKSTQK